MSVDIRTMLAKHSQSVINESSAETLGLYLLGQHSIRQPLRLTTPYTKLVRPVMMRIDVELRNIFREEDEKSLNEAMTAAIKQQAVEDIQSTTEISQHKTNAGKNKRRRLDAKMKTLAAREKTRQAYSEGSEEMRLTTLPLSDANREKLHAQVESNGKLLLAQEKESFKAAQDQCNSVFFETLEQIIAEKSHPSLTDAEYAKLAEGQRHLRQYQDCVRKEDELEDNVRTTTSNLVQLKEAHKLRQSKISRKERLTMRNTNFDEINIALLQDHRVYNERIKTALIAASVLFVGAVITITLGLLLTPLLYVVPAIFASMSLAGFVTAYVCSGYKDDIIQLTKNNIKQIKENNLGIESTTREIADLNEQNPDLDSQLDSQNTKCKKAFSELGDNRKLRKSAWKEAQSVLGVPSVRPSQSGIYGKSGAAANTNMAPAAASQDNDQSLGM